MVIIAEFQFALILRCANDQWCLNDVIKLFIWSKNEHFTILLKIKNKFKNVKKLVYQLYLQVSISPNFFCQVKCPRFQCFFRRISVQFHQQLKLQISSQNWHTFCQICLTFVKHCVPKKCSHSVCAKKPCMLMKSNPRVHLINILRAAFSIKVLFAAFLLFE